MRLTRETYLGDAVFLPDEGVVSSSIVCSASVRIAREKGSIGGDKSLVDGLKGARCENESMRIGRGATRTKLSTMAGSMQKSRQK